MGDMRFALLMPEHSAYRHVMQLAYPATMTNGSPRQTRRRENLRKLVEANGGQAQVALVLGTPKSHLSAILAGRRGVGDALAQKIEECFEKPAGWMDFEVEDQIKLDKDVADLAAEVTVLPQDLRERVLRLWREAMGFAQDAIRDRAQPADDPQHPVTTFRRAQR